MRKSTLLWLVLAAFCGIALFHTSQKVHDEREKLASLNVSIGKEEESLRVLNAEWGYLNQPERLEKLAQTYLKLAPLKGSQFVKIEDIALRDAVVAEATTAAPAPEEKVVTKPRTGVTEAPKPAMKIHKPAATVLLQKPAHAPASSAGAATAATNTRSFTDVMKSLHSGIE